MSPNKKVTKEVGIGEALKVALPRATAALSYVPLPAALGNLMHRIDRIPQIIYFNDGGGSALAALPELSVSILLITYISGKKSGHFLSEQELL